jgi:hypothetical protein
MIIVEGMDNTGKSTLVKMLAEDLKKLEARHSPSHLRGTVELIQWMNVELTKRSSHNYIYDRFPPISEEVYGPILRGQSIFKLPPNNWVPYEVLLIYCRPDTEVILHFTTDQIGGVIDHAKELITQYDKVIGELEKRVWGVFIYDYTKPGSYDLVKHVVQWYIDRRERIGEYKGF